MMMAVGLAAFAEPSLCRLDYSPQCEPVSTNAGLTETQKSFFQEWLKRYAVSSVHGETVVLALSDLPQAIRHVIFVDGGRLLSRDQVRTRLRSLGCNPETHPVWRTLLAIMPKAFGAERHFYAGLELAVHRLIAADPGKIASLRRELAMKEDFIQKTEAAKTPRVRPALAPGLQETARAG
jgi:hypothetical protein